MWLLATGNYSNPKASSRAQLEASCAALDIELDRDDSALIDGIEQAEELYPG